MLEQEVERLTSTIQAQERVINEGIGRQYNAQIPQTGATDKAFNNNNRNSVRVVINGKKMDLKGNTTLEVREGDGYNSSTSSSDTNSDTDSYLPPAESRLAWDLGSGDHWVPGAGNSERGGEGVITPGITTSQQPMDTTPMGRGRGRPRWQPTEEDREDRATPVTSREQL